MQTKGSIMREKILNEAAQIFNRQGIAATTINDLLAATGTTKGNLYFHFKGKEALALEVLIRAHTKFRQFLNDSLQGETPGGQLENFFTQVLVKNRERNFVGGCLFGNTALEASDTAPRFAQLARDVFTEWVERLSLTIDAAQAAEQIRRDLPADQLAELVVMTIEGGIMQARLQKAAGPLTRSLMSLRKLLELKVDAFAVRSGKDG